MSGEQIELNRLGQLMYRTSLVGAHNPEMAEGVVFTTALLSMDPALCRLLRLSKFDPFYKPERLPAAWEYVRKAWGVSD